MCQQQLISRPFVFRKARQNERSIEDLDIGILTTLDRDSWHAARNILRLSSSQNRVALSQIESAAFVVCLDDGSEQVMDDADRSGRCRRMLGGDGIGCHVRGEFAGDLSPRRHSRCNF